MVKPGQRRFLLNNGYTDEQLDKMSINNARIIISAIERKNERKRTATVSLEENYEDDRVVFFDDVVIMSREEYERLTSK